MVTSIKLELAFEITGSVSEAAGSSFASEENTIPTVFAFNLHL